MVDIAASGECKRRNVGKREEASGEEREKGGKRAKIKSSVVYLLRVHLVCFVVLCHIVG